MSLKKLVVGSIITLTSLVASANETEGKINNLYVNAYGVVLFKIGDTAPTECIDDRFPFRFRLTDTAGKEWFAMLSEAQSSGKSISLSYNENAPASCDVWALMHKA